MEGLGRNFLLRVLGRVLISALSRLARSVEQGVNFTTDLLTGRAESCLTFFSRSSLGLEVRNRDGTSFTLGFRDFLESREGVLADLSLGGEEGLDF
jgi:hypothetical protein